MPAKYIGDGTEHFPGLANEDMDNETWNALPGEVKAALLTSKLFEISGGAHKPKLPEPQEEQAAQETPATVEGEEANDGA